MSNTAQLQRVYDDMYGTSEEKQHPRKKTRVSGYKGSTKQAADVQADIEACGGSVDRFGLPVKLSTTGHIETPKSGEECTFYEAAEEHIDGLRSVYAIEARNRAVRQIADVHAKTWHGPSNGPPIVWFTSDPDKAKAGGSRKRFRRENGREPWGIATVAGEGENSAIWLNVDTPLDEVQRTAAHEVFHVSQEPSGDREQIEAAAEGFARQFQV